MRKIPQDIKEKYIKMYKETFNVSSILRKYSKEDGYGRGPITEMLKEEGIYEGLSGLNHNKKKFENIRKTMLEKYGVENPGQLESNGYRKLNKISYKKINYLTDDFKKYSDNVRKLTHQIFLEFKKQNKLPKYCDYTGIQFADEEGPVNPNDPRKRSIDHKIPIIHCYLEGVDVMLAANIKNIAFVLKYVNSVKGNTSYDSFLPLALKIRKVFINEGFKSK